MEELERVSKKLNFVRRDEGTINGLCLHRCHEKIDLKMECYFFLHEKGYS